MRWPRARARVLLLPFLLLCAWVDVGLADAPAGALSGRWKLNREQSDFPREVAFGIETPADGSTQGGSQGGTRGGGGGRGGSRSKGGGSSIGGFSSQSLRESEEDVNKVKELIADAKNPSPVLTISQTEGAVVITDSQDHTRTFHPTGKEETAQLAAGPVGATARWNGAQLSVLFAIRSDRVFHYIYSRLAGGQLQVETRLEEGRSRERTQVIRRVYDPD